MARFISSQGQIYDTATSRWMGPYSAAELRRLNGHAAPADTEATTETVSLKDLRARASELEIVGRSKMTADELTAAIAEAEGGEASPED